MPENQGLIVRICFLREVLDANIVPIHEMKGKTMPISSKEDHFMVPLLREPSTKTVSHAPTTLINPALSKSPSAYQRANPPRPLDRMLPRCKALTSRLGIEQLTPERESFEKEHKFDERGAVR